MGMYIFMLSFAAAGGTFFASYSGVDFGLGWSVFLAVVAFLAVQGGLGFTIQRRMKRDMERVQAILAAGQKRLQQKMQRWQMRPPGSIQAAQKEILDDTKLFVRDAIAETDTLLKYRRWMPMIDRQIATARVQLYWMIKEFRKVDELMPKAILLDPTMAAMKMARLQMLERPVEEIRKVYDKASKRVRYNGNVLIAGTMSWILVRRGDVDGAFKVLTEALKKSDDETLKRNHELLMNNRVAHFSNSGLGDAWYSLQLEEPKIRTQRQRR